MPRLPRIRPATPPPASLASNRGLRSARESKREAILAGALDVFARAGFVGADMDTIAAAAGASTRTIYKHFGDKAGLFKAVVEASTGRVADAQVALIERLLAGSTAPEADLLAFALAWTEPVPDHAAHFRLVRHLQAEAAQVPAEIVDRWQTLGPRRVHAALAACFARFARAGLLQVPDPARAVVHFAALVMTTDPTRRDFPNLRADRRQWVADGVRTFLYGHAARADRPGARSDKRTRSR